MTASTIPWTSGAAQVRRRHRLVMFATTAALVVVATTVVAAVSGFGWLLPDGAIVGASLDDGEASEPSAGGSDAADDAAPDVPASDVAGGSQETEPAPVLPEVEADDLPADGAVAETQAPETVEDEAEGDNAEGADTGEAEEVDVPAEESAETGPAMTLTEVQERLRELGYLVGPADGRSGQQTTASVMAFQRVHDLQVDGVVGPQTMAALMGQAREPALRGGAATRIEVDLDRQVLHLVEDGQRTVTLKVSSGNGELYRTSSGGQANARTPVGDYVIERRIHGVRNAALGTLYDPLYFHRGFAIHGSPSVPAGPASHGCVRISRADASWLIQRVPDGTPVQLYGGTHVFTPST